MTTIRCVQAGVSFADPAANVQRAVDEVAAARADGVDLVVLPECFLTGYVVEDSDAAEALAIPVARNPDSTVAEPGPWLAMLQEAVTESGVGVVVGFAGRDDAGLYNGAALLVPGQWPRLYAKTHLPCLGFDRFALPGDALPVFRTPWGHVGILVCFDLRIPEAARTLALRGAELIVLPTNWPEGAERTPATYVPTRASENRVFLATCNRVGAENGVRFIGQSAIHSVDGTCVVAAGAEEGCITAELDLSLARDKRRVVVPGLFETDTFATRQPAIYER